tara:strand:- start:660 stop:1124 length:465 start_codon:yes stop_codon:yes gene_type:complete
MMNWSGYITLASVATIKFMFSAIPGPAMGLSYIETVASISIGAALSAAFFYFSSEFFMNRARTKKIKLRLDAQASGKPYKGKKTFSKVNKAVVKLKLRLGKVGICFWAPFFLSVPVGSIVAAKFYGKHSFTFLFILIGILLNALLTSFIVYVII